MNHIYKLIFVRRVVGKSMTPRLKPGTLVWATSALRRMRPGQVVILEHDGKEKIKRIERINPESEELFVIGDNLGASADSRHFGWVPKEDVLGRVIWPKSLHN